MYRPWVGVLLALIIPGASQFLAGKRFQGVAWYLASSLLFYGGVWCLASPIVPGDIPAFVIGFLFICLLIAMLFKSYQPVPRFSWLSWVGLICLSLIFYEIPIPFRAFIMPTYSMSPTIQGKTKRPDGTTVSGDKVLVAEYAYWFSRPQRGDIIAFKTDGIHQNVPQNEFYAKRIIGIPGDILSIQNGHLYNHGRILSQPPILAKLEFLNPPLQSQIYLVNSMTNYQVPAGKYFVIGDNVTNSFDSRFFGPIPAENIIGKISKIYWPLARAGKIE